MDTSHSWMCLLLVGLSLSGICVGPSSAYPPKHYTRHAFLGRPRVTKQAAKERQKAPAEPRQQVNTVRVTCHPDSMEIIVKADMFVIGAPVDGDDLRLGVERSDYCRATASSGEEYSILVGLLDCGTKHWMTEDSLVYTNLLIYSPVASVDGLIRMEEAVIPIECHYERKYSVSSSSLMPTWIPFMSSRAAVETLAFALRIMTNDWRYERGSNVFHLGEPIAIQASIRVGHHTGLRVFVSSCVATLDPDILSVPRYVFIENGCLVDSQLPDSRSHFVSRTRDDQLHLVIDAFRFNNKDRGGLYITCHLNAVPVNDAQAPNKACTFINGRWRSADGNNYLCGHCQSQNDVGQTHSKPSSPAQFSPRGFGKPPETEGSWRSRLETSSVWYQEARVGPVQVMPAMQKTRPLPVEELPPLLNQIGKPTPYGSQWRSGINDKRVDLERELLPGPKSSSNQVKDQTSEQNKVVKSGDYLKDGDAESDAAEKVITLKSEKAVLDGNDTAALSDVGTTALLTVDVTTRSNATAAESGLSHTNDPKR